MIRATALKPTIVFFALFSLNISTGCRLGDNRIHGQIASPSNPSPPTTPTPDNYQGDDPTLFGSGTEADPYIIVTAGQLAAIGYAETLWDKHFRLGQDISLIGYDETNYRPIGEYAGTAFTGSLDGDNYSISHLNLTVDGPSGVGVFGHIEIATIKDLRLSNITIDAGSSDYVGALAGKGDFNTFDNIQATNVVISGNGDNYGILAGQTSGYILGSRAEASSVTNGGANTGGIVGNFSGGACSTGKSYMSIVDTQSDVGVTGGDYVGGIVGYMGTNGCIEGMFIYHAISLGPVTGNQYVGGIGGGIGGTTIAFSKSFGNISGANWVGDIAGSLSRPGAIETIVNSHSTGNIVGQSYVGGIVGRGDGFIQNASSTGDVEGVTRVGGIGGDLSLDTMSYCYATGRITASGGTAGGLVGYDFSFDIYDSYFAGETDFSGADIGGLVGGKFSTHSVTRSFWDAEKSGQSEMCGYGGCNNTFGKTTAEMKTLSTFNSAYPSNWTFSNLTNAAQAIWYLPPGEYPRFSWQDTSPFAGGDGSYLNPYQIATADQFNMVGLNPYYNGANFIVVGDIDFSTLSETFRPWSNFKGRIDGDGHTLSNLVYTAPTGDAALLTHTSSIMVPRGYPEASNLNIDSFQLTSSVGDAAALSTNVPLVARNIQITNSTINAWDAAGGLCVYCSIIEDSDVTASTVDGTYKVGGLASEAEIVRTSSSNATVTGINYVGGLIGQTQANVTGKMIVEKSFASGDVTGFDHIGGLVGLASAAMAVDPTIDQSYATGSVEAQTTKAGGLIGTTSGAGLNIENSYASGDVTSDDYAGGLIGSVQATLNLSNNLALGIVTGMGNKGGLIGTTNGQTISYHQNYWNKESNPSLLDTSEGDTGDTSYVFGTNQTDLRQKNTFIDWDFINIWQIVDGITYPTLR
ncbi:MAG: hypothetical protein KDD59_00140 [Bdellovibrionales bacterium]|nr:hypothetical protein [Bdellovibrionales bacterium]